MLRLLFDLESNALLPKVTRIHCLVTKNVDTGEVRRFRFHDGSLEIGLAYLATADELIGHNVLSFDVPCIQKLYPSWTFHGKITDTLVCSRLIWTDMFDRDCRNRLPGKLRGRHSLESWGVRLGNRKWKFGKTDDGELDQKVWELWTQEMEDYCAQDVEVTGLLHALIEKKQYSDTAIRLEHGFREIIDRQERHGFAFNEERAKILAADLQKQRYALTVELQKVFPARIETLKTPAYYRLSTDESQRWTTKAAAIKGVGQLRKAGNPVHVDQIQPGPFRTKEHPFNPGSRQQVAERLKERYGWEPEEFTDSGEPKISETILEKLTFPEAKLLCDFYVVQKTLGMVMEGDNAWLRLVENCRIHGRVNTNGAVTGRCTHSAPNVAQTPAVATRKVDGKKIVLTGLAGRFGYDCRALYTADPGHVLCGWDASGLELRCLAHYLAKYDGGAFEKLLLEGDAHTANQNAAGLYLRDSAKTFIYAYLYGAGDEKLGTVAIADAITAGKPVPKGTPAEIGKRLRARFERNFSALKRLKEGIKAALKVRPFLRGLDGRQLVVRSQHAALNTLLQSCGAILMKRALILQDEDLRSRGLVHWTAWDKPYDYAFVANIHDEVQTSCRPEIADVVGQSGPSALKRAGELFGFRCRLDGEYKSGATWADTH